MSVYILDLDVHFAGYVETQCKRVNLQLNFLKIFTATSMSL